MIEREVKGKPERGERDRKKEKMAQLQKARGERLANDKNKLET